MELENLPFSLPYWESRYYREKVERHLESLDRATWVLDAGCGDGRFTMLLLEMGFSRIVALDTNVASLVALEQRIGQHGATDRVTLVHGSVLDPPFQPGRFGAVLCIGVLYYLNERYEEGLRRVAACITPGGLLIESEPDQLGNAVKALIFDGMDRFIAVTRYSRFLEYFDGTPVELRCFSDEELSRLHSSNRLKLVAVEPVSLFPSLLCIGRKRGLLSDASTIGDREPDLWSAFDYFDRLSGLAKHKIWVLSKE